MSVIETIKEVYSCLFQDLGIVGRALIDLVRSAVGMNSVLKSFHKLAHDSYLVDLEAKKTALNQR